MVTAFTTALPPAALPVAESVLVVVGTSLLYAVLIVAFAIGVGVLLQGALAQPARRRPALRLANPMRSSRPAPHAA